MKHRIIILFLMMAAFCQSCNKDSIVANSQVVGSSRITYYVELQLQGNPVISVLINSSFVDPGVIATENGDTVTYTTSGSVDVTTPGLYVITYSAVNKDGYPSSVSRTVVVIPAPEQDGIDISGKYDYVGSSTFTSTIAKVAPGVYSTDNCWSGATVIPCIFVCLDGANITIPDQQSAYGPIYGTGTLDAAGNLIYIVSLPNYGISNSARTWIKD